MKRKLLPLADIIERENDFLLVSEFPGVSKDTLEIEIEKGILKIKGAPDFKTDENWKTIYREFSDNYQFERSFELGNQVDTTNIKAKIENGVLVLVLPKSEEVKPRKIKIA